MLLVHTGHLVAYLGSTDTTNVRMQTSDPMPATVLQRQFNDGHYLVVRTFGYENAQSPAHEMQIFSAILCRSYEGLLLSRLAIQISFDRNHPRAMG